MAVHYFGVFFSTIWMTFLNNFLTIFFKQKRAKLFTKKFDNICKDLGLEINDKKKQLGYIVDFLELEFDTL